MADPVFTEDGDGFGIGGHGGLDEPFGSLGTPEEEVTPGVDPYSIFGRIEGYGIGRYGGTGENEPYGSVRYSLSDYPPYPIIIPPIPDLPEILFPPFREGAIILGMKDAVYETKSGVIRVGRTAHIDSSGDVLIPLRRLIFE